MSVTGMLGAIGGGVVGAIIWGSVSYCTNYEIGYVAWAIGLLVGFGAVVAGGFGQPMGVFAAIVALASIFGGKLLSVYLTFDHVVHETLTDPNSAALSRETYDEYVRDAEAFSKLESDSEYRQFIAEHAYAESEEPNQVTEDEIRTFSESTAPMLRELHADKPTFEQWRDRALDRMRSGARSALSLPAAIGIVRAGLNLFDLLFAGLGLYTAYQVPSSRGPSEGKRGAPWAGAE